MKKDLLFLSFVIFLLLPLTSNTLEFDLSRIYNPNQLLVKDNKAYIVDGATVFVFSKKSNKPILNFGRKGSGPGEFKVNPAFDVKLNIKFANKNLFLHTFYKFAIFDLNGNRKSEQKTNFYAMNAAPIMDKYVVKKYKQNGKTPQYNIVLMNKDLKELKTLHKLDYNYKLGVIEPIQEYADFKIHQNKIYLLSSGSEFKLKIYNQNGDLLIEKKLPHTRVDFTSQHKTLLNQWLKTKAWYKMIPAQYRKKTKYPDMLPAGKDFLISNHKLFVHTYKKIRDKTLFFIIDLKDYTTQQIFLPVQDLNFMEYYPYYISNHLFYYIMENSKGNMVCKSVNIK